MLIRAALIVAVTLWTGYWVAGLAVAVLMLVWTLRTGGQGPPVLALALTYQWMQVTIGIFYTTVTGQQLDAMLDTDWQPMVVIGLVCITCLAVSIYYGAEVVRRKWPPPENAPVRAFSAHLLYIAYGASLLLTPAIQELAWEYPAFGQGILAVTFSHLALLFILTRRFSSPTIQWRGLSILMAIEVAIGFTGYFAGFREPLTMCAIAVFEVFDRRDVRHWVFVAVLALVLGASSVIWISVRGELRQDIDDEVTNASRTERFDRARTLTTGLLTQNASDYDNAVDKLIDRLWAIKYPAMALARVPAIVPHSNGQMMNDALVHLVTPRFLFPDKPDLPSDSELVRKYAGAQVAGAEQGTSIAFGYAAESYVDYGLPWMFIPVLIFGFVIGVTYQWWLSVIEHRELAIGLVTVIYWLSLYLFENSWAKRMGLTLTLMVYLGGLTYLLDQWLVFRRAQQNVTGLVDADSPS